MVRITVLAGAAAALILLGIAVLNASPRWESHVTAHPLTATAESALSQ